MQLKIPPIKIFDMLDEKQKNMLMMAVVFLLTFFICYKIIYQNAVKKTKDYNYKTAQQLQQNRLRKELADLDNVKTAYENLIAYKEDIDKIKNKLSAVVESSGARLVSIRSMKKSELGNYSVFSTSIELECSFHQLGLVVASIENMQPYTGVESVKIIDSQQENYENSAQERQSQKSQSEGSVFVRANLTVETYLLKVK